MVELQNVTVTTTPTLQNIGIESQCNITVKNSTGDNLIITTSDSRGQLKSFTVYAGNSTIIKKTNAYQVSFKAETTTTTFSAVISWPDEVDPSSLTVAGTINTDIGQRTNTLTGTNPITGSQFPPSLDGNNRFIIRALSTIDNPDTSVNQLNNYKTDIGAANTYLKDTKIPTVLAQDTNGNIGLGLPTGALDPRQIRALTSTDIPGKSWTLASNDNPILSHGTPETTAQFAAGGSVTPTAGYKWMILGAYINVVSNGATLKCTLSIGRSNNGIDLANNLGFEELAGTYIATPTSGAKYYAVGGIGLHNSDTADYSVAVNQWGGYPIVYPGDYIYFRAVNVLTINVAKVFYTQSNI